MSYFSNQSNSRFLANTSSNNNNNNNNISSAASTTSNTTGSSQASNNPSASKSRQSSSKLFSTSVAPATGQQPKEYTLPLDAGVHPLKNTWVFWFRQQRTPGNKILSYEEGIKRISSFSSVETFWSIWTHMSPPSALQPTTDYLLFHSGVHRPVWEDPVNISGGKWIIRLKKGVADRIWENLIMAVVGDQFVDCRPPEDSATSSWEDQSDSDSSLPEICGCTISVRQSEDIVSVWNRVDADSKVRERIRDAIRKVLDLPPSTIMEYKSNNDSMHDKSSFRNSAIDRTSAFPNPPL